MMSLRFVVRVPRRPSWLSLTPEEIEALIPDGALDRRPAIRPDAQPFTLP